MQNKTDRKLLGRLRVVQWCWITTFNYYHSVVYWHFFTNNTRQFYPLIKSATLPQFINAIIAIKSFDITKHYKVLHLKWRPELFVTFNKTCPKKITITYHLHSTIPRWNLRKDGIQTIFKRHTKSDSMEFNSHSHFFFLYSPLLCTCLLHTHGHKKLTTSIRNKHQLNSLIKSSSILIGKRHWFLLSWFSSTDFHKKKKPPQRKSNSKSTLNNQKKSSNNNKLFNKSKQSCAMRSTIKKNVNVLLHLWVHKINKNTRWY